MNQAQLVALIYKALPLSHLIFDLEVYPKGDEVRFSWRRDRYRVRTNLLVDQVMGHMMGHTSVAILMEKLLKTVREHQK